MTIESIRQNGLILALTVGYCLMAAFPSTLSGNGGPENVLVVVNANQPTSLAIANHYVQLRGIPAVNVVYLDSVPDGRDCSLVQFRQLIGDPVIQAIEDRKLGDHIDYVTFSTDFPTMVSCPALLDALKEKAKIPEGGAGAFKAEASTSSLMAFYLYSRNDDPSVLLLDTNWYMSQDRGDPLRQPFVELEQARYESGVEALASRNFEAAVRTFTELADRHPMQVAAKYQLARALAQSNRASEAIAVLKRTVAAGWVYREFTRDDAMLVALDNELEFQELLVAMPDSEYGRMPTRGFSSQYFWGPNGWPNSQPGQGKRILLTTMLGVAGGTRGCTRQQIMDQLSRSVAADCTLPIGIFYFAQNGDVRTKARQDQFLPAIAELAALGYKGIIGGGREPQNLKNILGATLGSSKADWLNSGSLFAPGAICDNLTSHGGRLQDNGTQTPLTHFLKLGAAGSSGTVTEPLAIANKFAHARIHVHYVRGCNLAESYYQSVFGPFQLLIVGDPLCQPWARRPEFEVTGIADGMSMTDSIEIGLAPSPNGPGISRYEMYVDGRKATDVPGNDTSIRISSEGLADGFHEIRIVAVDNTLIGTRSGKRYAVTSGRAKRVVQLKIEGPATYQLARSVLVSASSNFGDKIEIRQNTRVVATIDGNAGEARIDCFKLGIGRSTLQAAVLEGEKFVLSQPVSIEINPD